MTRLRNALATALYRAQSLSLGQAARFSGLSMAAFIQHVSKMGIPVVRGAAASVREDVETIRTWRAGSSQPTQAR